MKKKVVIGRAVLLFTGFAWWANSDAGKEFVRKDKKQQAAKEAAHPEPKDTKARLLNGCDLPEYPGSYHMLSINSTLNL